MQKFTDEMIDQYFLLKADDFKNCLMCKEPTQYIDICCEGRLCSVECHDEFYRKFNESCESDIEI